MCIYRERYICIYIYINFFQLFVKFEGCAFLTNLTKTEVFHKYFLIILLQLQVTLLNSLNI